MKLGKCTAENFGSYSHLEIDFSNLGLALIYGPTGAGKSTIPDLAVWALYGITAKEGNVDDIRSWQTTDKTTVTQEVITNEGLIQVTRIRGKQNENDLYWTEPDSEKRIRGKDLADTQRLLSARLAVNQEEFVAASYFHEFSRAGEFFTATAKARKAVFDGIVDLTVPNRIQLGTTERRKTVRREFEKVVNRQQKEQGRLDQLRRTKREVDASADAWQSTQKALIEDLKDKTNNYHTAKLTKLVDVERLARNWHDSNTRELNRLHAEHKQKEQELGQLPNVQNEIKILKTQLAGVSGKKCPSCGSWSGNEVKLQIQENIAKLQKEEAERARKEETLELYKYKLEQAKAKENPYLLEIESINNSENKYEEQLIIEQKRTNPHTAQSIKLTGEIAKAEQDNKTLTNELTALERQINALNQLYDLSYTFRQELLINAVKTIEINTNNYLEEYFDAELKVSFELTGTDSLDVNIQKNGYEANFRQLSKGQRQLLKLSFVVSIMEAAADKTGIHFDNLFFDEALDGLDTNLKVKAFSLFDNLSKTHGSILLIDHAPEFQNLFDKRFAVTLENDNSKIVEE